VNEMALDQLSVSAADTMLTVRQNVQGGISRTGSTIVSTVSITYSLFDAPPTRPFRLLMHTAALFAVGTACAHSRTTATVVSLLMQHSCRSSP
jgi:hypothetical protein